MPSQPNDPQEIKAGSFKWLDRIIYKGIGDLQIDLNESERAMLVKQLQTSLKLYETLTLAIKDVRRELYAQYTQAIVDKRSAAQFSRDFNMSKKGHNELIADQIVNSFKLAFQADTEDNDVVAGTQLKLARLRFSVLFDPAVVRIVEAQSGPAHRELIRIGQFREKLFLSTMKMVSAIARGFRNQLDGSVVEWSDLLQEAVIAAMHAVETYDPIEEGKTFTSYIYRSVSGTISKRVNETTRTVPIPRTVLDRFVYVNKALDNLNLNLSELRGGQWHDGELSAGQIDYDTLEEIANAATMELPNRTARTAPFSPKEVQELLLTTQDEISLDQELESIDGAEYVTLGEMLPSEAMTVEQSMDGALVGARLMALIKTYTNNEEYAIMSLRYGSGTMKGYKAVAEEYASSTGKSMNKGKAAEIEHRVLNRIQTAMAISPSLKDQFRELLATVEFMEE